MIADSLNMPEFEAPFHSRVVKIGNREGVVASMKPQLLAEVATYYLEHATTPEQRDREMRSLSRLVEMHPEAGIKIPDLE